MSQDFARPCKRRRIAPIHQNETPPPSPCRSLQLLSPRTTFDDGFSGPGISQHGYDGLPSAGWSLYDAESFKKDEQRLVETTSEPEGDVCFGMITEILVDIKNPYPKTVNSAIIHVHLKGSNTLLNATDASEYGTIDERWGKILHTLEAKKGISIQLCCQTASEQPNPGGNKRSAVDRGRASSAILCAVIYGTFELFEDVGDFVSACKMYLQDPLYCDRNVPYCNPHLLSRLEDQPVMTFSLKQSSVSLHVEDYARRPDLSALLYSEHTLAETMGPPNVATTLYSHQKQALTFMLRRERSWAFEGTEKDIWARESHENGRFSYVNTITGKHQDSAPPEFRGGLLADEMGLGKTLTMISLIAANPALVEAAAIPSPFSFRGSFTPSDLRLVKTTLLILPLPLLKTWGTQLSRHLHPSTLSWQEYHGDSRKRIVKLLGQYDIILTTYNTVSLEWKKHMQSPISAESLFSTHWHRIVLDEAHIIQNRTTLIAKASFALHATNRWAMTGTPIQNKLTDLASVLQFLRVYPFSDPKIFDSEILKPWLRSEKQGFLRLKALVNCVVLCRTKVIIDLPKRSDEIHYLSFSAAENSIYETAKIRTSRLLDTAIATDYARRGTYINALQWLNALRLICNHGILHSKRLGNEFAIGVAGGFGTWNALAAQKAFESLLCAGAATCVGCSIDVVEATSEDLNMNTTQVPRFRLSECLFLLCGTCILRCSVDSSNSSACAHTPKCRTFEVSLPGATASFSSRKTIPPLDPAEIPTKLKALIADIQKLQREKCVVFSYWTFTLDLVESTLKSENITYTRLDGQISADKRAEAVRRFQDDLTIQVVLVSISCGGVGLDLTAASRAYLLEPQWNPMMEEQALCRVHRMGQTKAVTTIRYIMKNSFEEKVVLIQYRDKETANLTFSNARLSEADVGAGRLQYLRAALG